MFRSENDKETVSALPRITGKELESALQKYEKERALYQRLPDSEGLVEFRMIFDEIKKDLTTPLSAELLLKIILIYIKTDCREHLLTYTVLSELLKDLNWRVPAAIMPTLTLPCAQPSVAQFCLVDCLPLMAAKPKKALDIAMAKTYLFLLLKEAKDFGIKMDKIQHYYDGINSKSKIATRVMSVIKDNCTFNKLLADPEKAEAYFKAEMPAHTHKKAVQACPRLFSATPPLVAPALSSDRLGLRRSIKVT